MSTLPIDFPSIQPGPVGEDGLNDYQRAHLAHWIKWYGVVEYVAPILRAVKEDPRLLLWADWPTMLRFGIWLEDHACSDSPSRT